MIVKELDEVAPATDALVKAGRAAEEQVAFYLRRAFADDALVRVVNGVRLEKNGDAAQIDHLVLLPWGFVIIESKSVTTKVTINDRGEWARWFNGRPQGMPSPILQAQRQGEFLMGYLAEYARDLRDKWLFRPRDFVAVPCYVFVAISDSGIVERPTRLRVDEACKADQVVEQIRELVASSRHVKRLLSMDELSRISQFLVQHHKPYARSRPIPATTATPVRQGSGSTGKRVASPGSSKPACCRHCRSTSLAVRSGRYGYYYKCQTCDGNTHIDTTCAHCGGAETIRQNGRYYLTDCKRCGTSTIFYPLQADASRRAI